MDTFKRPEAAGLYDPAYEHDNCGVGAVADLRGDASHETLKRALHVLDHLEHRGAAGAEADTGDGAGILLQLPDEFMRAVAGFDLPAAGAYACGMVFLPREDGPRAEIERLVEESIAKHGQTLLGWRDVPVDHSVPGASASEVEPVIRQVLVGSTLGDQDAFERKLYAIRRTIEKTRGEELAIPSFSSRTLVYKGMLMSPQLPRVLPGPARRADEDEARARPLALQHEHLPELAARAPVPLHRPQRRDQHAARQRQLDAGARVAAAVGGLRRRPRRHDPAGGRRRGLGLGDLRQRARAARRSAAGRSRTR